MSDIFKLQALGHGAATTTGVIKAADVAQIGAANHLLQDAQAQADAIIASAREVYETEKARGFAQGRAEADGARAAQTTADLAALDRHLAGLDTELGAVVFSCVKRIIEGFDDETQATEIARSALGAMRAERRGQLHVSTSALEPTRTALPHLLEDFPEIELVDVIEDIELEAPNVRLETTLGTVNFVLEDTLESLRRLLEQREA